MPDSAIQEALKGLKNVRWRETAFADLQWYYAEEGVYVFRCKHGEPNEHLCVIRAKSADAAIARAVFNLHKDDEKKKSAPVGDCAKMREALKSCLDFIMRLDRAFNPFMQGMLEDAIAKAHAALAAPARNCNRFATVKDAAIAFARERQDAPQPCPDFIFSAWLLAPATEKEGESNEQK